MKLPIPVNLKPVGRVSLAAEGNLYRLYRHERGSLEVEHKYTGKTKLLFEHDLRSEGGNTLGSRIHVAAMRYINRPENKMDGQAWARALSVATDGVLAEFADHLVDNQNCRVVQVCLLCSHECGHPENPSPHLIKMMEHLPEMAENSGKFVDLTILARPAFQSPEPCATCGSPDPGVRQEAALVIFDYQPA